VLGQHEGIAFYTLLLKSAMPPRPPRGSSVPNWTEPSMSSFTCRNVPSAPVSPPSSMTVTAS
jgi:hypothetical protein